MEALTSQLSWMYHRWPVTNETEYTLPHVSVLSDVEDSFKKYEDDLHEFLTKSGLWLLSIPIGFAYVIAIFALRSWMQKRERFELRGLLIAWNIFLAAFSLVATLRTAPELIDLLQSEGFIPSICNCRYMSGGVALWNYIFALSKLPEMGDTVFIVLRKQPLIFLHWYHHLITMWLSVFSMVNQAAVGRWCSVMNFSVHTIMYSYYALKAMKIRVPRRVSMVITSLQWVQMVVACYVFYTAFHVKRAGLSCQVSYSAIGYLAIMYASYVVLFGNFFYKSYIVPKSGVKSVVTTVIKATSEGPLPASVGQSRVQEQNEKQVRQRLRRDGRSGKSGLSSHAQMG